VGRVETDKEKESKEVAKDSVGRVETGKNEAMKTGNNQREKEA
jgi:hypothetical protein